MLKEIIVYGCFHGACGWATPIPMAVLFYGRTSLAQSADVIPFDRASKFGKSFLSQFQHPAQKAA